MSNDRTTINVKNVTVSAWNRAKPLAHRTAESMGTWLSRAIDQLADREESGPREFRPEPPSENPKPPSQPAQLDLVPLMHALAALAASGVPTLSALNRLICNTLEVAQPTPSKRMGDLYDADVLEWSKHQARLLQQHMAGEPSNEAPDWGNIIKEIESGGRSELASMKSLLRQALLHNLKAESWPLSGEVLHWQAEARRFRADAADRFSPSMRQNIDVPGLYRQARRLLPDAVDGQPPLPMNPMCEVTLDELLSEEA